jgi:gliding motility-associated-like protein
MRLIRHLFIAGVLLFSAAQTNAQKGQYDARFLTKTYDCANRTATIQLQVRAKDTAHTFNMGDANYRFEYDTRLIGRPRIVAQPNFSNLPPANDYNYSPQNLNGSTSGTTRGLVSVNTFYSGAANGAKRVDTAWMTVSEITFDVVKIDSCFELFWHNDVTFPISGMSEVVITKAEPFAYDLFVATSTGYFGNVQACFKGFCEGNKQPSVAIAPIVVPEDSTKTVCSTIQDANLNDYHRATVCQNPKNGTATLRLDTATRQLCVTYQPNLNYNGQDTICINMCDIRADSLCQTIKVPVTITPRPDAPVVRPTLISLVQDSTFNGCFPIVDPDLGDTHTVTICGNPKNGTVRPYVANGQVCLTYQPNPRFIGQDSVCLTICDNTGLCTSQTWQIRVSACYDTIPPTINCPKQPILISAFGEIVSNPTNFLTKSAIGDSCTGVKLDYNVPTATDNCTSNPSVNLTSGLKTGANFPSGTSNITFTAKDSAGLTATCTVQVIVAPKPARLITGGADTLTVCQNEIVDASATIVTGANYRWTYPNGLTSTLQRITTSSSLLGKSDWLRLTTTIGNCTYKDSVYVNILGQPIVVNDNYETNRLLNGNVITNDTLAKSLKYKVTLMSNVGSGTLVLNPNGTFTYNPTTDSTFTVSFVYKVCYDACPSSCQLGICYIKLTSSKRQEQTATNVITPNGDGVNDVLTILNFDGTSPTNKSAIVIYNQWGDVVHRAEPYRNDWSGTFNDNPLPDGTYYFIFKRDPLADPIKNFVTIIR